MKEEMLLSF